MPTRNEKTGSPYPEYQIAIQRAPRQVRAYVGETRAVGFQAFAEQDASKTWREGTATIYKPDGSIDDAVAVAPSDNRYTVLVSLTEEGIWEVEFEYGHDSRPTELLKHKLYIRAVV